MPLTAWEAELEHLQGARYSVHTPVIATPQISAKFKSYQTQIVLSLESALQPVVVKVPHTAPQAREAVMPAVLRAINDHLEAVEAGPSFHRAVMRTFEQESDMVEHFEEIQRIPGRGF